jgi:hypothetical protein
MLVTIAAQRYEHTIAVVFFCSSVMSLCNLQHISCVDTSPLPLLLLGIDTKDIQLCSAPPFYRS